TDRCVKGARPPPFWAAKMDPQPRKTDQNCRIRPGAAGRPGRASAALWGRSRLTRGPASTRSRAAWDPGRPRPRRIYSMSPTLTGGCNCGAVRFEITEPLFGARYCHCARCQRRTGTAASANAAVVPGSFRIVNGEAALKAWIPPDGHEKWFCGECGSAIFTRDPTDHAKTGVRLGAIDGDPGVRPEFRQFVAYCAPWEEIPNDGLPRYPERALP